MVKFTIIASGYAAVMSTFSFDSDAGKISLTTTTPNENQPSWIQASPDGKSLFAAYEYWANPGLAGFTINADGTLTNVSTIATGGTPVALAVLSNGKEVVSANYDTGTVFSYPINEDGTITDEPSTPYQIVGSGPNVDRQTMPHLHHVVEYKDEILIADLGSDEVWRMKKGTDGYELAGKVTQAPGSGPRHLAAHDGKLFVLHELDNSITYYSLPDLATPAPVKRRANSAKFRRQACAPPTTTTDAPAPEEPTIVAPGPVAPPPPQGGDAPQVLGNFSTIPTDAVAGSVWAAAELLISPDGKFLYATNRNIGEKTDERGDPIFIYSVEPFAQVDVVYTGLVFLRGAVLGGPNGEYLIGAGQKSGGVVVYARGDDGLLTELDRYTGEGSEQIATFAWL